MFLHYIKFVIDWLHMHPHLAGVVTFCIAAIESIAILGLLVPGSVFMTGIGTLIGAGILPFWPTLVWAMCGAIIGDGVSYWFGRHYHDRIRVLWPFRRFPKLLEKGELFFKQHGAKSVMLGRFAGPVRPIVPLIAGMMNMRPRRFITANVISGIIWAPLYMTPGMLIGATAMELPPEAATQFIVIMLALIIALWLLAWLIRHILLRIWLVFDRWLARFWQSLRTNHDLRSFVNFIQDSKDPEGHHQLTAILAGLFFFGLFCWLTQNMAHEGLSTIFNLSVFHLMRSFYTVAGEHIFTAITMLGTPEALFALLFTLTGWLLLRQQWRAAAHWFVVVGFGYFCALMFKHLFEHPRPSGLLNPLDTSSYPSAHTMLSLLIFNYLASLIARELPKERRWITYFVATLFTLIVGLSRLYLGAHWLTDIVGAILLGTAFVFLGTASYRRRHAPPFDIKGALIVTAVTLAICYSLFFTFGYQKQLERYTPYWPVQTITFDGWWQHKTDMQPQYRTSHFGKPMQLINVEWAGSLSLIKDDLERQGWQSQPVFNLANALKHFTLHKDQKLLPLLPSLYQDRPPVLILTRNQGDSIFILRLWNPYTYFTDSELPLWFGIVDYQDTSKHHLIHYKKIMEAPPSPEALFQLTPYLKEFEWKIVVNPINSGVGPIPNQVLMVKQSENQMVIPGE